MVTSTDNYTIRKKAGNKRGPGQPPLNLDLDKVYDLAKIHCTIEEIAIIMKCSVQLLQNSQKYIDIIKKGKEEGRECLRRLQFKIAEGRRAELLTDDQGNVIRDEKGKPMIDKPGYAPVPAMAIFLGKNLLGQTDQQTVSLTAEKPVEVIIKNYEKEPGAGAKGADTDR